MKRDSIVLSQLFETYLNSDSFIDILTIFNEISERLNLSISKGPSYLKLKSKIKCWKAQALWAKLDKKYSQKIYRYPKTSEDIKALIIGAGPCGLRTAIELALLNCGRVVVVEKRDKFSRNNVLHLWPFVLHDLKSLGAKKFFAQFCAGSIDHIIKVSASSKYRQRLFTINSDQRSDLLKNISYDLILGSHKLLNIEHHLTNICIRKLQTILLKIALILGVEIYEGVEFVDLVEPSLSPLIDSSDPRNNTEVLVKGWKAQFVPRDNVTLNDYEFDVIVGADGKRNTLKGFKRKEFRGKLAIAVTANFINHRTERENNLPEISGTSSIFNPGFFARLKNDVFPVSPAHLNYGTTASDDYMTPPVLSSRGESDVIEDVGDGEIDLENLVYYKDDTHYFVMTAKKQSLLSTGVLKEDLPDASALLNETNVDRKCLLKYATRVADFCTDGVLTDLSRQLTSLVERQNIPRRRHHQPPRLLHPHNALNGKPNFHNTPKNSCLLMPNHYQFLFAPNHYGQGDVSIFDFTSMFQAENSCRIVRRKGKSLLMGLVGDTLLEPFWPLGTGCPRGFLSALDMAWTVKQFASGKFTPLQVIAERESIYKLLSQTSPENSCKNTSTFSINPLTRYPNLDLNLVKPHQVQHLYDTDVDHDTDPQTIAHSIQASRPSDSPKMIPIPNGKVWPKMNGNEELTGHHQQPQLIRLRIRSIEDSAEDTRGARIHPAENHHGEREDTCPDDNYRTKKRVGENLTRHLVDRPRHLPLSVGPPPQLKQTLYGVQSYSEFRKQNNASRATKLSPILKNFGGVQDCPTTTTVISPAICHFCKRGIPLVDTIRLKVAGPGPSSITWLPIHRECLACQVCHKKLNMHDFHVTQSCNNSTANNDNQGCNNNVSWFITCAAHACKNWHKSAHTTTTNCDNDGNVKNLAYDYDSTATRLLNNNLTPPAPSKTTVKAVDDKPKQRYSMRRSLLLKRRAAFLNLRRYPDHQKPCPTGIGNPRRLSKKRINRFLLKPPPVSPDEVKTCMVPITRECCHVTGSSSGLENSEGQPGHPTVNIIASTVEIGQFLYSPDEDGTRKYKSTKPNKHPNNKGKTPCSKSPSSPPPTKLYPLPQIQEEETINNKLHVNFTRLSRQIKNSLYEFSSKTADAVSNGHESAAVDSLNMLSDVDEYYGDEALEDFRDLGLFEDDDDEENSIPPEKRPCRLFLPLKDVGATLVDDFYKQRHPHLEQRAAHLILHILDEIILPGISSYLKTGAINHVTITTDHDHLPPPCLNNFEEEKSSRQSSSWIGDTLTRQVMDEACHIEFEVRVGLRRTFRDLIMRYESSLKAYASNVIARARIDARLEEMDPDLSFPPKILKDEVTRLNALCRYLKSEMESTENKRKEVVSDCAKNFIKKEIRCLLATVEGTEKTSEQSLHLKILTNLLLELDETVGLTGVDSLIRD